MGIFGTVIIGLVIGVIAKLFMPGRDPGGILVTIVLGVTGSFVAGWLGRTVGLYDAPLAGPGIIASVIGAILLLVLYRFFLNLRGPREV